MVSELVLLLGVALTFVFGWNNSSFLIGGGEGSGSLTLKEALLVSSAGLLLGVLTEGSDMLKSLGGSLTPVAVGEPIVVVSLGVSLGLTVVLSGLELPVSFSMAIVGAFAGAVVGSSLPLNTARLGEVAIFWGLSPLFAAVLAFLLYSLIVRWTPRLKLVSLDVASRYGVIFTTVVIAYVLGANNVGLIYGVILNGMASPSEALSLGLVVVAIVGMVALGRGGISGSVGDRLLGLSPLGVVATFLSSAVLIWVGTELSIPISISQCLMGGMFGAAWTKQFSVINARLAVENIGSWVAVPLGAFLLGLLFIRL
jgi:inorganic phosphate transporter, PiT family